MVLVTNNCQSATDERDFPIPQRNVAKSEHDVPAILQRVLNDFEEEQADYERMRALYRSIGPETLAQDTKCFLKAILISNNVTR